MVSPPRPNTVQEFLRWSTKETCGEFRSYVKSWYGTNQANLSNTLSTSDFLHGLRGCLSDAAGEYRHKCSASLFALSQTPVVEWDKKTYESFVEKLYRLNCVENDGFPEPPDGGWYSLENSFQRIGDIVRTTVTVAYADGPAFLADKIKAHADQLNFDCSVKDHAKDKGYYAHHVSVLLPLAVSSPTAADEYPEMQVPVEIQITTQLQDVLREITHKLYEEERLQGGLPGDWKTQFKSGRFRAAYMAHSLRFIEAMIVELRDALQEKGDS